MAKMSPNSMKTINSQIHKAEAQQIPSTRKMERKIPKHIIIKLPKTVKLVEMGAGVGKGKISTEDPEIKIFSLER